MLCFCPHREDADFKALNKALMQKRAVMELVAKMEKIKMRAHHVLDVPSVLAAPSALPSAIPSVAAVVAPTAESSAVALAVASPVVHAESKGVDSLQLRIVRGAMNAAVNTSSREFEIFMDGLRSLRYHASMPRGPCLKRDGADTTGDCGLKSFDCCECSQHFKTLVDAADMAWLNLPSIGDSSSKAVPSVCNFNGSLIALAPSVATLADDLLRGLTGLQTALFVV